MRQVFNNYRELGRDVMKITLKCVKKIIICFLPCCFFILSGCTTFQINELNSKTTWEGRQADPTLEEVIGVEKMAITSNDEYGDAEDWQQSLSQSLKRDGGFKYIVFPYYAESDVDLIIRGQVSGQFRNRGFLNFITWWPGPFLLMHNWRGTRYIFDAQADVELIDKKLNTVIKTYHADASHEMIHRSNNPGPIFGAVFFIPGVIKGIMSSWPREKYRKEVYEVAYPALWKKISQEIANDQAKRHAERLTSLRTICGSRINETPETGMTWENFVSCQTHHFVLLGKQNSTAGEAFIYENLGKSIRVQVIDGKIAQWFNPKTKKLFPSDSRKE